MIHSNIMDKKEEYSFLKIEVGNDFVNKFTKLLIDLICLILIFLFVEPHEYKKTLIIYV